MDKYEDSIRIMRDAYATYKYAIKTGLEDGRKQGLEEGMAQGIEKGMAQGIEKGKAEAEHLKNIEFAKLMLSDGDSTEKYKDTRDLRQKKLMKLRKAYINK